jgi:multicomponent Na+:H+ antiporter subunit G
MVFILITSPTAAHALARAARVSGIKLWEGSVVDQFEGEQVS